jgi:hypothetical protein
MGYWLGVIGYWLGGIGYWLGVIGYGVGVRLWLPSKSITTEGKTSRKEEDGSRSRGEIRMVGDNEIKNYGVSSILANNEDAKV